MHWIMQRSMIRVFRLSWYILSVCCVLSPVSSAQSQEFLSAKNPRLNAIPQVSEVRYVSPSFNWSATPAASYPAHTQASLQLAPCPPGISGDDKNLYVLISGGNGGQEVAAVSGGSCRPGAPSGTLEFTPSNDHSRAFTVGSASSGIYEALRDATTKNPNNAKIVLSPTSPPGEIYYSIYAPVLITGGFIDIDCSEAMVDVETARAAFVFTSTATADRVHNCRVATKLGLYGFSREGAVITKTSCDSSVSTVSSTLNPPVGSLVEIQGTFNTHYWGLHEVASTSSSAWTYVDRGCGSAHSIPPQLTAGGNGFENAFVEDDGGGNHFDHIEIDSPKGFQPNTLNNLIVVLNDQAAHISDVQTNSGLNGCNTAFCANAILAPGPFSRNAAVIYADHLNFSLNCTGNGVTDFSGNTLSVSDSVIQGFNEWAVVDGVLKGGYGPSTFTNVYNEVGNCTNPLYPGSGSSQRAEAGLLAFGQSNTVRGGEGPGGSMPMFAASGNRGAQYNYYLVIHDSALGTSAPLWCGFALVDRSVPGGKITVACPRVQGTNKVTYDLIRTSGAGGFRVYPSSSTCTGGSTGACGSVLLAQPQCDVSACTFVDFAERETKPYALGPYPSYFPKLNFWPGSIVLDVPEDTKSPLAAATQIYGDDTAIAGGNAMLALQSQMSSGMFKNCSSATVGVQLTCLEGSSWGNNNQAVIGTLLQNGGAAGGGINGIKGRLNFFNPPGYLGNTGEVITLWDCHPDKTLATAFYRPPGDPCDDYIGIDKINGTSTVGTAYGASRSQSWYIGTLPDDVNWSARLDSQAFTFQVPIGTRGVPFSKLPPCSRLTEGLHRAVTDSASDAWGAAISGSGTKHVEGYCDGTRWTVSAR